MDDNMYKGSSQYFGHHEPSDQKAEREREEKAVYAEYPIISDFITALKEQAEMYGDVSGIPNTVRLDPHKLAVKVEANIETKANIESVIVQLQSIVEEYIKTQ